MSHYAITVALPGDTKDIQGAVEQMLEPYDEELETQEYPSYFTDNKYFEKILQEENPELLKKNDRFAIAKYMTQRDDEKYFYDEKENKYYQMSARNPNAKWDWYEIGGRWQGMYVNKQKEACDAIRKSDINFEEIAIQARREREETWHKAEQEKVAHQRDKESQEKFLEFIYGIKPETSKEEFIQGKEKTPVQTVQTFAVLDENGWNEKGEMGWWGITSNEKDIWPEEFEKWFEALQDDAILVCVDCHI